MNASSPAATLDLDDPVLKGGEKRPWTAIRMKTQTVPLRTGDVVQTGCTTEKRGKIMSARFDIEINLGH